MFDQKVEQGIIMASALLLSSCLPQLYYPPLPRARSLHEPQVVTTPRPGFSLPKKDPELTRYALTATATLRPTGTATPLPHTPLEGEWAKIIATADDPLYKWLRTKKIAGYQLELMSFEESLRIRITAGGSNLRDLPDQNSSIFLRLNAYDTHCSPYLVRVLQDNQLKEEWSLLYLTRGVSCDLKDQSLALKRVFTAARIGNVTFLEILNKPELVNNTRFGS